ncbi:MAG: EscU/YscU/HrcU family type III secretion system export apparatus switch protein [Clostridia bacterium]|nr:EscU/YscU/HrcU family type III secretion system export apparatus switch protein [Clostridia bacterium]
MINDKMKENLEKNKGKEEKLATAITYEESEQVPKVVATGKGHIAEKIIEEGEKENITIYKDKELAHLMKNLDVGEQIPPSLYNVVAQVLVFVSDMDLKVKEKLTGKK